MSAGRGTSYVSFGKSTITPAKPAPPLPCGSVEPTPLVSSVEPTLNFRSGAGKAGTAPLW